MAERTIGKGLKAALELGPVAAFFIGYLLLKDKAFTLGSTEYAGFIVVTAAFVPLMIASTLALWALTGSLSKMQIVTLVIVVVFGGLSVWLNDERFFKMKPTMIYSLLAVALGVGLLRRRSYLGEVMGTALPLDPEGWLILTRRLALFFVGLAVLNEVIWRKFSTETWVSFKTFGLTAALLVFFMTQSGVMARHKLKEPTDEAQ